jgi:hypothetical protein
MRFTYTPKRVPKVEPVCSTDKTRPEPIHHPHLSGDLAELQATNTTIAVRIPVELERGEATGPVDEQLLAAARKAKAEQVKVPKSRKPKKGDPLFPESTLLEVWPSADEEPVFRLGIDAGELKKLADALGSDQLELRFPKFDRSKGAEPLRCIVVRTVDDIPEEQLRKGGAKGAVDRPEGLIMPIRLRGDQPVLTASGSKSKKPVARGAGEDWRSEAARKAVETRRRNAEAAGKTGGTAKKQAAKPKNGTGSVASTLKSVAKPKRTPAAKRGRTSVPRSSRNGAKADRGKGSAARIEAARKAAETRRKNLAAKAK